MNANAPTFQRSVARWLMQLEADPSLRESTFAFGIGATERRGGHPVDEIEVYLGYQVMLREPLALPVETSNMAFFRCSGLTQQHLYQAQVRVQQAERTEFANYLSTNFTPWRELIQRLATQLHEQAQGALKPSELFVFMCYEA